MESKSDDWNYVSKTEAYAKTISITGLFIVMGAFLRYSYIFMPGEDKIIPLLYSLAIFFIVGAVFSFLAFYYQLRYEISAMTLEFKTDIDTNDKEHSEILTRTYRELLSDVEERFQEKGIRYQKLRPRAKEDVLLTPYVTRYDLKLSNTSIYICRYKRSLKVSVANVESEDDFYFESVFKDIMEEALNDAKSKYMLRMVDEYGNQI